jgi:cell wall-associated NlpC family hydrolase
VGTLETEILSWVGTPWRARGRGRGGVDCAGLVESFRASLGLPRTDPVAYTIPCDFGHVRASVARVGRPVLRVSDGDVVVIRFGRTGHLGLACGDQIVHACRRAGKVIAEPWDAIAGGGRVDSVYRMGGPNG